MPVCGTWLAHSSRETDLVDVPIVTYVYVAFPRRLKSGENLQLISFVNIYILILCSQGAIILID